MRAQYSITIPVSIWQRESGASVGRDFVAGDGRRWTYGAHSGPVVARFPQPGRRI